jgi:hypothetical protein
LARLLSSVIRRAIAAPKRRQTKIGSISNYGYLYPFLTGVLLMLGYVAWGLVERADPRGVPFGVSFIALGTTLLFFAFKQARSIIFSPRFARKDTH